MGRPLKTKVSETSAVDIKAVIDRVAKKLKTFTVHQLNVEVDRSFQKADDAENATLDLAVAEALSVYALNGKYTVSGETYTVVPGKRGRPRKVAVEVAAAV